MFENVRRFLSPINQAVIVFQIEHELAMGGPLFGRVSLLFENRDPIEVNGIFGEHVLWQIDGQYVALARWSDMKSKYLRQKLCVIDVPNLQIGEFEKRMVIKQLTRFENKVVECECYEERHTSIFIGELQNLKFDSLNNWNPV